MKKVRVTSNFLKAAWVIVIVSAIAITFYLAGASWGKQVIDLSAIETSVAKFFVLGGYLLSLVLFIGFVRSRDISMQYFLLTFIVLSYSFAGFMVIFRLPQYQPHFICAVLGYFLVASIFARPPASAQDETNEHEPDR